MMKRCNYNAGPFICSLKIDHLGDHKSIHGEVMKA